MWTITQMLLNFFFFLFFFSWGLDKICQPGPALLSQTSLLEIEIKQFVIMTALLSPSSSTKEEGYGQIYFESLCQPMKRLGLTIIYYVQIYIKPSI